MRVSFFLVSSCCMEVKVAVAVARTVFSICFFKASTGHTTVWYAGTAASSVQHMLQYTHTCMHVHMQYPVCIYVCMQYVKLTRQTPSNGAFSSLLSLPHSLTPRDVAGELVKLWAQLFRSLSLLLRPFTRSCCFCCWADWPLFFSFFVVLLLQLLFVCD